MPQGTFLRCVAQNEILQNRQIIRAGEHFAVRGQTVPPRAPDLLLIVLQRLRKIEVINCSDI